MELSGGRARRARVLWLSKGLGRGGVERLLVEAARRVDRERFDVEVAYMLPWKSAFVPDLEAAGVDIHCLGARSDVDPRWMLSLRRLLHDRSYDLVHAHMPLPAVAARILCRGEDRPRLVYTEHNVWTRYRMPTRWANAVTYRRNDAVIAVSNAVAESITPPGRRPGPPVQVILHGPDGAAIAHGRDAREQARALLDLPRDDLVIGTVGNLAEKKDHRTLLAAFAKLHGAHTIQLVMVGTGPLSSELANVAKELRIDDRVHFLGMRDDVYELLAGLDVFAMSSRFEGLPIALLEAMSAHLPVVATSVGGIPEVVTSGTTGILVRPGDPAALAHAIQGLLDDPDRRERLGDAAASRASRCDITHAVRCTEAVYDSVFERVS